MLKSAYTSPKIHSLARRLRIPFPHALGMCGLLWNFANDHAPWGDIGKHDVHAIAAALHWTKDAEKLIQAFVDSRLMDRGEDGVLYIHDWEAHCPQWVKNKRHSDAKRVGPGVGPGVPPGVGPGVSYSSISSCDVMCSSLSSSSAGADAKDEEDASLPEGKTDDETMTKEHVAAIAKCPRKAAVLKALRADVRDQRVLNELLIVVFRWPPGEWIWDAYTRWRAGLAKAKNRQAYWARCIRNEKPPERSLG